MSGRRISPSDDGYSLAEALAALLIIGLTMGLLFQGVQALAKLQARTLTIARQSRTLAEAERALTALLADRARLDAELSGDASGLRFACSSRPCSATLDVAPDKMTLRVMRDRTAHSYDIPAGEPAKLVYEGEDGRYDIWPPSDRQVALRGVSVVGAAGGERPLIVARPWIEQPTHCEFDMIARACRTPATAPTISTP